MRIILVSLLLLAGLTQCTQKRARSVNSSTEGKGKLEFTELSFNFGELSQGDVVGHRFQVINRGTGAAVIQKADKGCGCTDVIFPKKPINPQDTAYVEIIFDSNGWFGRQVKQVVIVANDSIKRHELLVWANIK
ncbi:DUF1573 domain-containing protein [Carboxylicivirga sp. M1479]|uniref:DUF1573 domain-containing protein n=1 Tax=Carboxylicivirga sp. M1479 TaxID=2594476 RepID=UPI001178CAE5|nr:DUF1573 domain-containing protein [Carboxylicivirga sp. M1479]TRX70740.1 DUF1573 domain-containing protein [Carboxylicivirga sp. M1479]